MNRREIVSSMILSAGHDTKESILEIEFSDGEIWQYFDVPEAEWKRFIRSDSKGRAYKRTIKYQYGGSKQTMDSRNRVLSSDTAENT